MSAESGIVYSPYIPIEIPPTSHNLSEGGKRDPSSPPTFVCGSCGEIGEGTWIGDPKCDKKGCLVQHGAPQLPKDWAFAIGKNCHGVACSSRCGSVITAKEMDPKDVLKGFDLAGLQEYEVKEINPELYGKAKIDDL